MALPLHERASDGNSDLLVRLTGDGPGAAASSCSVALDDAPVFAGFPSLIPPRPLAEGEQYRFHFNMTKCIGCRSCEVACNEQNGNPASIAWRRVGELESGSYPDTHRHYLSMGCNHCVDAECVRGCPVNAYTKDPVTGIVLHSADACIGCQYCVWNCPYSVPQFNPERGVVGKCDMCQGRLEEGREPACVNACPEAAIEIEIVNIAEWSANYSAAESPGMPSAGHTVSTTRITLPEQTSPALERVDSGQIRPERAHWSLVFMTTLMQAVSGALIFSLLCHTLDAVRLLILLVVTGVALTLSTTHLGRPAYAWRALKMWHRSWLSREVLLFTLFALALTAATVATAAAALQHPVAPRPIIPLEWAAAVLGVAGTLASAFIYLVPARPSWNMLHTPVDFLLTAGLLGTLLAAALSNLPTLSFLPGPLRALDTATPGGAQSVWPAVAFALAWILNHAIRIVRLRRSSLFEERASHGLLSSEPLRTRNAISLGLGPIAILFLLAGHPVLALTAGGAAALLARYLFFVSVVPLNMALTFYPREGRMTALIRIRRLLGIDIAQSRYAYGEDPRYGYVSASRVADTWVKTTCGYCSVGCGMLIGVKNGKAVAARGNPDHPVNNGKLCPKGLSEHHVLDAPGRATTPLLRKNGKLEPVSWDEALDMMIDRIGAIQAKHGLGSLGVVGTGQLLTEEFYTLGKLVQLGFRTPNYDGNTTLCMASAVSGYKLSFGSDGPPGSYRDIEVADVVLLIGANIADNHPILCNRLERNKKRTLIVVDPRVTKTAMMADIHLPVKPRSDIALINGIAHILIRDGLIDRDYIAAHTTGFADLAAYVRAFNPEHVAKVTGLSTTQIEHVAMLYGRAKAAFIGWTMGVNHSTQGAVTVAAINNLALLTGNIGRAGAAPFSITGQCNAMGTREAGFASSLPGYRKFENAEDRAELASIWGISERHIPRSRGLAYPDIIEGAVQGRIKALWFIATNPAVSFPNYSVLEQALRSVDFLVVQDGFHPTPTSDFADLVLPAAIWGEKEGTYTNSERRVSKVNRVVTPPGEARADFNIFLDLAERLGVRNALYEGWSSTRDAFEEWKRISAGRMCDYSSFNWEDLEDQGGSQWGGERLYADGVFPTADGRAKLHCVPCDPFVEQPNKEYDFILNTGRTVEHWHTRTKTARVDQLNAMVPNAWLEMNPIDAQRLRLSSHDRVTVVSRRSRVADLELRITAIVAPGQVFMPFHFSETNSNLVTLGAFDPISREPNFKQCAVRIEKTTAV